MTYFGQQIILDSNCGQDYRQENPLVRQARNGLVAYTPIYNAGCLKDAETGNYCFSDAITNTSNPSDVYPYYTALGLALPASAKPTCSKCLQDTMSVYASSAPIQAQPVSGTYVNAAQQIDLSCGSQFVNASVPVAVAKSSAAPSLLSSYVLAFAPMVSVIITSLVLLL